MVREMSQSECNESDLNALLCGECDEPIEHWQASCIYDGGHCHTTCAAEAEDEAGFDDCLLD